MINNKYSNIADNTEYNIKKVEELLTILNKFSKTVTADDKRILVEETWSKEVLNKIPITIQYGELGSVRLYTENKEYKLEFNFGVLPVELYEKHCPEIINPYKDKMYKAMDILEKQAEKTKQKQEEIDQYVKYNYISINKSNKNTADKNKE